MPPPPSSWQALVRLVALVVEAEVSDLEQVERAVAAVVAEFGQLDIAVADAGLMLVGPVAGAAIQDWTQIVEVNLLGLMYTAHATLRHLLKAATERPPPSGRSGADQQRGWPKDQRRKRRLLRDEVRSWCIR